jgi:hypothetical protein
MTYNQNTSDKTKTDRQSPQKHNQSNQATLTNRKYKLQYKRHLASFSLFDKKIPTKFVFKHKQIVNQIKMVRKSKQTNKQTNPNQQSHQQSNH